MTGINDWVKVTALDFQGKFVLCSKLGKWIVFGPKTDTSEVFFKSVL